MYSSTINDIIHKLNPLQSDVIRALLYFDIFQYPLTKAEIKKFMSTKQNSQFDKEFDLLIKSGHINQVGINLFGVSKDTTTANRRIEGNTLATKRMETAKKVSKLISCFPFVRCIMLSGSLSKGYMEPKSDLDFFIVTEPNRLWIARTFLIMFKRIFLFNSRKYFCVNYFIDINNLEIEEKNIFTAIESATLIPTYGKEYYQKFWSANSWVSQFLPNSCIRPVENVSNTKSWILTSLTEKLLSNSFGDYLDTYFMKMTLKRWKHRYSQELEENDFSIAFKTRKDVSKSHPQFFQKKVLEALDKKIKEYEGSQEVHLSL